MSGAGFQEFIVLFVIGLIILGPERLPRVATQIGRWVGKARRTANQLRYQLEREITLADIEEQKKEREKKRQSEAPATEDSSDGSVNTADRPGEDQANESDADAPLSEKSTREPASTDADGDKKAG